MLNWVQTAMLLPNHLTESGKLEAANVTQRAGADTDARGLGVNSFVDLDQCQSDVQSQ